MLRKIGELQTRTFFESLAHTIREGVSIQSCDGDN